MKITFLGTGTSQGIPVISCNCAICRSTDSRDNRLRSSIRIEMNGKNIVVDAGPDFRQQMLRENINTLDAIVFTHSHKDHTGGLDDIRPFNFKQHSNMPIYGTDAVLTHLKKEYYYAFLEKKYPGTPEFKLHEIKDNPFEIDGIPFLPLPVSHLHMPVLGFRIGDFSYITDANYIPQTTLDRLKKTKILVLNALQKEKHISHFNLKEAIEIAQQVRAEQTYFTHISHKLGLHDVVNKELPKNIRLGYDMLTITL